MRRLKNSIESERFNDGVVYVYPVDSMGDIIEDKGLRLFYGERNLSYKRIMEARQTQSEYTKIIAVPLIRCRLGEMRCAVIYGRKYRIESIQEIYTSVPSAAVMALSDWDIDTNV